MKLSQRWERHPPNMCQRWEQCPDTKSITKTKRVDQANTMPPENNIIAAEKEQQVDQNMAGYDSPCVSKSTSIRVNGKPI